jgi:V8-like Glu-specific endopeptidase
MERSDNTAAIYAAATEAAADTSAQFADGVATAGQATTTTAASTTAASGTAWGELAVPQPAGDTQTANASITPAFVPSDKIITYSAAWPYNALGRLNINGGTCSATQIGDYTIVSAAHCIYNRATKTFSTKNIWFEPATYRDTSGTRRFPYTKRYSKYYTYLNSWVTETDNKKAWWYVHLPVSPAQLSSLTLRVTPQSPLKMMFR